MKVLYFGDADNDAMASHIPARLKYCYSGSHIVVRELRDKWRANRDSQNFGITRHAKGFILYPLNVRGASLMEELPSMARGVCRFIDVSEYEIGDGRIAL